MSAHDRLVGPILMSSPSLPPNADKETAVKRTRLLLGCYRQGDFADPDIAMRAFVAVFMRYPEKVVTAVTEPGTGIPARLKWPPSIAEVVAACDAEFAPTLRRFRQDLIGYETLVRRLEAPTDQTADLEGILARCNDAQPDDDLKAHKRDDLVEKERQDVLDSEGHAKSCRQVVREYAALGQDPVYCVSANPAFARIPISPSLAKLLRHGP